MTDKPMTPKRCILYYPTISIPGGYWLRHSLLYWDEVGSIVPQDYDNESLVPFTPEIQYLKDEGEFRPFRPDALIKQGWNKLEEFESEFKAIIKSPDFQRLLPPPFAREKAPFSRIHKGKLQISKEQLYPYLRSRVHENKVSHGLFQYLQKLGLAKHSASDSSWYYFEDRTALLYMALLAKYLADEDVQSTIPGTDDATYEGFIFQVLPKSEGFVGLNTNFLNLLPIPRQDVPLSEILKFKRKRRDELLRFRQLIDEFQKGLRVCQSKPDTNEVITAFKEKVESGVNELQAVLNDAKLATIPGSLKAIIKLDSSTLWATAGVLAGQATKIADIPIEWSTIGIGVVGSIEIATYLIDKRNERRATLRNSPFAYLYQAQQKDILDKSS